MFKYILSLRVHKEIYNFYTNVAKKYKHTYDYNDLFRDINNAYDAIYEIENGLPRRKPTLTRWRGLYMASYIVKGKTRWNYAYRIEDSTVYVEDACHAQNMSEFSSSSIISKPRYRKLTKRPLFGYSFVMNDRKEYNLIDSNGKLLTQWFRAIRPINKPQPYGKYQIIAYINVDGFFCALGYDGQVYNLNKTWKEMCSENRNILNTTLFMNIITENIDNTMKNKKVIRLTESELHNIVRESTQKIIREMNDETPSKSFDEIYQMIIDCNDAIRSFFMNTYSFTNSDDARSCKRILSIADSLHAAAHEFQEHLAWD